LNASPDLIWPIRIWKILKDDGNNILRLKAINLAKIDDFGPMPVLIHAHVNDLSNAVPLMGARM